MSPTRACLEMDLVHDTGRNPLQEEGAQLWWDAWSPGEACCICESHLHIPSQRFGLFEVSQSWVREAGIPCSATQARLCCSTTEFSNWNAWPHCNPRCGKLDS